VLDHPFRFGVHAGGGFVQNQDIWVKNQGAYEGDQLPLAHAEGCTALLHVVVVATGKFFNELVGTNQLSSLDDLLPGNLGVAKADVVEHRSGKEEDVLQDHRQ